jgi:hypothetical protein
MKTILFTGFQEISPVVDGILTIQKDNEIYVIYASHQDAGLALEDCYFNEDDEVLIHITLLGENKFKINSLFSLYQFNLSKNLTIGIQVLAIGLKTNGYSVSFIEKNIQNPALMKESVISNSKVKTDPNYYAHPTTNGEMEFEFNFKGKKIVGNGTCIKYVFFEDVETMPDNITELFTLVVDLNKLIGKACAQLNDKWFMACDNWVKDLYTVKA